MDQTAQHGSTKPGPQPVVVAIVTSEHGVLLGRRNDGKPPWTFIAGEIAPGESPAAAGVREVKEEIGLLVAAGQEIGRRVHPATGRTMIYMAARPTHGTDIFVGDRDELAEVRWVTLAEAEHLMLTYSMFGPAREFLDKNLL
jgi:NADH pyrophosphatase NudC (nudix superfamily)